MEENRCICCGEIIPEGLQVCPSCQVSACHYVVCTKEAYEKCEFNGSCWPGMRVSSNSDCAEFILKEGKRNGQA